ncbi:hypothetical protein [Actinocrispum sp. NPDC049592]|uniref:hypothetical protein n=1 Tax=Actinocrispum sp. NPDC049592 TaxID=3154835 RepID=UPI00343A8B12
MGDLVAFNAVLIAGITAFVVVRQFTVREVNSRMYIWIALLIVRGVVPPGPARMTVAGIAFLVAALVISVVFGVLRGTTMPMWRGEAGKVLRRGGRVTLVLWLATILVRLALGGWAQVQFGEPFNVDALWLGIGVTLAVQQFVMTRRAGRLSHAAQD